jgi:hypothetical protein
MNTKKVKPPKTPQKPQSTEKGATRIRYSAEEKMEIARVVNSTGGNINKALRLLQAEGHHFDISTVRDSFLRFGDKKVIDNREHLKYKDITLEQAKASVKIFEASRFNGPEALPIIARDIGIKTSTKQLRRWYREYGKEVVDDNRFRDVVASISENLAEKYKDAATSIVELAFQAKRSALERLIEMMPMEKDMNKVAMAIKILSESNFGGVDDKPSALITQYNNYFSSNETEKNRDKGNIQDVTPITE